jgi:hypothetical protein
MRVTKKELMPHKDKKAKDFQLWVVQNNKDLEDDLKVVVSKDGVDKEQRCMKSHMTEAFWEELTDSAKSNPIVLIFVQHSVMGGDRWPLLDVYDATEKIVGTVSAKAKLWPLIEERKLFCILLVCNAPPTFARIKPEKRLLGKKEKTQMMKNLQTLSEFGGGYIRAPAGKEFAVRDAREIIRYLTYSLAIVDDLTNLVKYSLTEHTALEMKLGAAPRIDAGFILSLLI